MYPKPRRFNNFNLLLIPATIAEIPPLTKTKTYAVSSPEPLSKARLLGTNQ
jgi:hypothetical protein